jgi:VCBS repeat-containing protein
MIASSLVFGAALLGARPALADVAGTAFRLDSTQLEGNLPPEAPTLGAPADGATGVSRPPYLSVQVSDPEVDDLTVTFWGKRKAAARPDFTIAVLPDTQFYTVNAGGDLIFKAQTQWIVDNQAARNIVFVSHVGDATENGRDSEWQIADAAMNILESPAPGIPYGMVIGNHDKLSGSAPYLYEQYFGVARFTGRAYYGDHFGSDNLNYYELFSAGGMDFIVINLDSTVNPMPPAVLDWADGLLQTFSSRRAIIVGHYMIFSGDPGSWMTQGQAIYEALKDRPNLFLMLGGHISGEGQRTDTFQGSTVYTLLADYQGRSNGGDGWLRIMEFSPTNNEIRVKTYSPTLDQWETDVDSQFILPYDMTDSYATIGTVTGVASGSTASLYWTGPASGSEYEWYVTVSDGVSTTTGPTWSFTTAPGNQVPLANDDTFSTVKDNTLNAASPGVLGNDNDPDGDQLTAIKLTDPQHGMLDLNSNGSFIYTPAPGFSGSDSFIYKANDGALDSNVASVNITVNPINSPPVAVADSYSTDINIALNEPSPGVLDNDSDPDGDQLTAIKLTDPQHGTVDLNTDGSFIYTPDPGFTGIESFTYRAIDGTLGSNVASVSISVNPINNPPVAVADSYSTDEDTVLGIDPPGVLGNDSDPDGDQLTAIKLTDPQHGTLNSNGDGSFAYTPHPGYAGSDSFTYRANDGALDSNVASVSITITPTNDPPVADADSYSMAEDTPLAIDPPGVLVNDSDAEGDPLTAHLVQGPGQGTLNLNPDGSFIYTPIPNFNGEASFTYRASDSQDDSNVATATVTVTPVNDAPLADDQALTTEEDTPKATILSAYDEENDPLTYSVIDEPRHGTLSGVAPNVLYTPQAGYYGVDSFTFRVNDGTADSNLATISITVNEDSSPSKIYLAIIFH